MGKAEVFLLRLMWTLRRNLSVEMDSPWSTEGPFADRGPHILCILGRTSDWILGFSHYALLVYTESITAGKPQVPLLTNGLRSVPSSQNCTIISSFAFIPTNQNAWYWPIRYVEFGKLICIKLDQLGTFSIKGGLPFILAERTFSFHWSLCFPGLQTVSLE